MDKDITIKYNQFKDDVFVIDCWPDTKEKEEALIALIKQVKVYGAPIILCGHYPVNESIQRMVDYFIYDGDNDILLEKDFEEYGVNSDRWVKTADYELVNKTSYHHDYAIWLTMKNAFNLAKQIGKQYIHFLEYDNLPDEIQYRQAFMEYVRNHDAVIYEYEKGSSSREDSPFCATYIFSIKTDVALAVVNKVNSKEEYFKDRPGGWQLERVFYQTLKSVTNNVALSKYIANNGELNTFAVWNRDGATKGVRLQCFLGVDENGVLYLHTIPNSEGKSASKDYLVELTYNGDGAFVTISKDGYGLMAIGEYVQGATFELYHQGVKFYSEVLSDDVTEYRRKNKLTLTEVAEKPHPDSVNFGFVDGPGVEIKGEGDSRYRVEVINEHNNRVMYTAELRHNQWAKASVAYCFKGLIKVTGIDNDYVTEHRFNPKGKTVFISFESKSIGDTLAWIEYVERFRVINECYVVCSTFHNDLLRECYPEITFTEPGSAVQGIYALYRLGLFFNQEGETAYSNHPTDPKQEPLTKIASDILGLDYVELRPRLPKLADTKKKMVSIAIHSTAQLKYWNNPTGWQEVVDFLNGEGYEVRLLSIEEDGFMGNNNPKGVTTQPKGSLSDVLKTMQESEFFIGVSSGLSWLSWGGNVPTILISGFTDVYLEPFNGVRRIINKEVCNGCWGKFKFDAGDWNWCPIQRGTDRQFECTKEITSQQVINEIRQLISDKKVRTI